MDMGYHLFLFDNVNGMFSDTNKNNDLFIYFFNNEDYTQERGFLLLTVLFILSTYCGMVLCMIIDMNNQRKIVYKVTDADLESDSY